MMEITNEEQVEQALQEWVSALDVLDDPIFVHDRECRILRCNRAYQRLAALPFEQIIGQHYFKVFPKSDGPLAHCVTTINDENGNENEDEITVGNRLYRSRFYVIREGGRYLYSVHILEDITRQRHDEEKLKQNELFIKTVLDNLPIGIAVNTLRPKVAFSYMNDNFPKLYRTTREALSTPDAFWEAVYEDREFRKKIKKQVTEDAESGYPSRMRWSDIPISRKGKKTTYISAQNVPLPDMDAAISMVWDVTDRKQTEDLLRSEKRFSEKLIESIPDIFFLLDKSGNLIRWNKNVETLFGLTPEQLPGLSALEFIHAEDRPDIAQKTKKHSKRERASQKRDC